MAFDTSNYLPKLKQLTEATQFAPKKSGVGSTLTGRAGSASRARTAKMIGLGQKAADETMIRAESSARGVRKIFDQVDVDREEQDADMENAAWLQAIEESLAESKAELKKSEEDTSISKVDFDEGMIDFALGALSDVESLGSGGYQAVGPVVKKGMYKGKRAYGMYQVMEPNIGPWTEKYYGTRLTTQEFLNNQEAQDAVAENIIMANWEKYGNIEDAISVWFTGKPVKDAGEVSDGYTTAPEYLKKWNENFIRRREEALGAK